MRTRSRKLRLKPRRSRSRSPLSKRPKWTGEGPKPPRPIYPSDLDLSDPRYTLLHNARSRARKAGLMFLLSKEDIQIPELCPALGISLFTGPKGGGPHSPSLELVDPELGYVPGNVIVLSSLAQRVGGNATPEELRRLADFFDELGAD